jgi:hypothetical protein
VRDASFDFTSFKEGVAGLFGRDCRLARRLIFLKIVDADRKLTIKRG